MQRKNPDSSFSQDCRKRMWARMYSSHSGDHS